MLGGPRRVAFVVMLACAPMLVAPSASSAHAAETTKTDPFKAKLVESAALAARVTSALAAIAHRPPPKHLTAEQRKAWDEQSRWLGDASARFAAMKKTMDAVLAKTKVSPSELAQTSLQFAALQEATQAESRRFESLAPCCRERHEATLAALKSP